MTQTNYKYFLFNIRPQYALQHQPSFFSMRFHIKLCLSLFLSICTIIGGIILHHYGVVVPKSQYQWTLCTTVSSDVFISKLREDFFVAFTEYSTQTYYPLDVLGSCDINDKSGFPSCHLKYSTIAKINQTWSCATRFEQDRPTADIPTNNDKMSGAIIMMVFGSIGFLSIILYWVYIRPCNLETKRLVVSDASSSSQS